MLCCALWWTLRGTTDSGTSGELLLYPRLALWGLGGVCLAGTSTKLLLQRGLATFLWSKNDVSVLLRSA